MLKMVVKRLAIDLTDDDALLVQQRLQGRFNSLFHKVRLEYLHQLGLGSENYALTAAITDSDLVLGDLFLPQDGVIAYVKSVRASGYVVAGVISRIVDCNDVDLFAEILSCLKDRYPHLGEWEDAPDFVPISIEDSEAGNVQIDEHLLQTSRVLVDDTSRHLLETVKAAGSIFLNKLSTEQCSDCGERIASFVDMGLINKEYAVLCRRTGQQILRVADRRTIEESSERSFRCFICGEPLASEVVEEILTSTALSEELFSGDRWLLLLAQGVLGKLGVCSEDLRVYRIEGAPTRLFLNCCGQRYLVVLCTDVLSLDQANLIGAHISAYGINRVVMIATQRVSTLMRHYLSRLNADTVFHFIDNLGNLEGELGDILLGQQRQFVHQQLQELSQMTMVNIPELILQKVVPNSDVEPASGVSPVDSGVAISVESTVADGTEAVVADGGETSEVACSEQVSAVVDSENSSATGEGAPVPVTILPDSDSTCETGAKDDVSEDASLAGESGECGDQTDGKDLKKCKKSKK